MAIDPEKYATEILERKKNSLQWMEQSYYGECEKVLRAYYCNREPEVDENGKADSTQTSFHTPDTFAHIRRTCARVTAQLPDIKFHAKDFNVRELINRGLMYQWDKAEIQLQQKLHVSQALMFGWSVRPWYWALDDYVRNQRIDPMKALQDEMLATRIGNTYADQISEQFQVEWESIPPEDRGTVIEWLLSEFGRSGTLKVSYIAKDYEGPKCDFLLIADCMPRPHFESIQKSEYFIVERRRNKYWMEKMAKWLASEGQNDAANRIMQIMADNKGGTPMFDYATGSQERSNFRSRMLEAAGRVADSGTNDRSTEESRFPTWVITEEHCPGPEASLAYVFEGAGSKSGFIGKIPYPYDLGGRIAFTELVFIQSLFGGVGDANSRVLNKLQDLHSRNTCVSVDLANSIARPIVCTTDEELYENAEEALKRGKGLRVVLARDGQQSIWGLNEAPAQAALAATLQDDGRLARLLQMGFGENNMSQMANVDPQQNRTATGARLLAFNQDVLTKDLVTMLGFALQADIKMMFELNRSELTGDIEFDANRYNRTYTVEYDPQREQWAQLTPQLFQADGEIIVEPGSTLADDDEAKQQQALTLMQMFRGAPNVNQDTLRDRVLIAMGEGKNLRQWQVPPQPPPQEPPTKSSINVSAKLPELTPAERIAAFNSAGIQVTVQQPPPDQSSPAPDSAPPPLPPGGAGQPMGAPTPPPSAPPAEELSAYAASKGVNPLSQELSGGMAQQ